MKKYQKISVNINEKDLKKLDKIVEDSDDFSVTRTTVINKAIKFYLQYIEKEEKKGA